MKADIEFETDREIIGAAIELFGVEAQVIVALEEMAELSYRLTKWLRDGVVEHLTGEENPHIELVAEEIADVQIMLWQMAELVGRPQVVNHLETKLQRLRDSLKEITNE